MTIVIAITCADPLHPGKVPTVARFQYLAPWERPAGAPPWVMRRDPRTTSKRVQVDTGGEVVRGYRGPRAPQSRDFPPVQGADTSTAPVDHATVKLRCPLCARRSLDVRAREDRLHTVLDELNLHGVSCVTLAGLAAILGGSDDPLSGGRL